MCTRLYIWTVLCLYVILTKVHLIKTFHLPASSLGTSNRDRKSDANNNQMDKKDDNDMNPETSPDLFQGDIATDPPISVSFRLGLNPEVHKKRFWPNRTIPFEISDLYKPRERQSILHALKTLNAMTCIKFRPYDGVEKDYLLVVPDHERKGCWSYVGRRGGEQVISLQAPDKHGARCFGSEGIIMHEFLHAIGIHHEQSREDRDNYVKIHWENIVPDFSRNFRLILRNNSHYNFDYDYHSIMHYGEFYFSQKKNKKPTITPLKPGIKIGQRRTLSKTDCLKVNDLYGCLEGRQARMYRTFCFLLGV